MLFSATKTEYVLRPGDVISIRVIEHEEFSQKCRIRPDGMVNYPVIGEIEVGGLTSEQLVKIMEEKLAPYVNNVVVSVAIDQYFSNRIFVIGDVGRTGEIQIFEPIDILKCLALAGGLKSQKIRFLKIIRANGDISTVDLKVVLEQKGATNDETYLLYPGDTLYVPERFQIPWAFIATVLGVINMSISLIFTFVALGS
ncbi:MAG: polysaccharide biosynthesis/export family protein [Fibrobacterota bacterium]